MEDDPGLPPALLALRKYTGSRVLKQSGQSRAFLQEDLTQSLRVRVCFCMRCDVRAKSALIIPTFSLRDTTRSESQHPSSLLLESEPVGSRCDPLGASYDVADIQGRAGHGSGSRDCAGASFSHPRKTSRTRGSSGTPRHSDNESCARQLQHSQSPTSKKTWWSFAFGDRGGERDVQRGARRVHCGWFEVFVDCCTAGDLSLWHADVRSGLGPQQHASPSERSPTLCREASSTALCSMGPSAKRHA